MTPPVDSFAHWLADYYFLSTILLVIAVAALLAIKQPAKRRAVAQSTLVGLIILAALCAIPGWSIVNLMSASPEPTLDVQPIASHESTAMPKAASGSAPSHKPAPEPPIVDTRTTEPVSTTAPPTAPPHQTRWSSRAVFVWFTGAASTTAWLVIGWFAARRLRHSAQPAPATFVAMLRDVLSNNNTSARTPDLLTSTRIDVAVAMGIWRPAVLLPAKWLPETPLPFREGLGKGFSRDDLFTILAHEAAHLSNHDLHWLALSRALNVVLWAQPLYWLVRRCMRLDQEALADAAAAQLTSRQRYAEQLVAWAHNVGAHRNVRVAAAVGLWEGKSQLRRRIALLLDERLQLLRDCPRHWRFAAIVTLTTIAFGLSLFTLKAQPQAEALVPLADYPTVKLRPGPVDVEGRCSDGQDRPIADANVALLYNNVLTKKFGLVAQAKSNANGNFKFANSEEPDRSEEGGYVLYWVVAWKPGLASSLTNMYPKHPRFLYLVMPEAATLSGRVNDAQGKPVAGAIARFDWELPRPLNGVLSGKTDANGKFAVTDLRPLQASDLVKQLGPSTREVSIARFRVEHPDFATASVRYERVPDKVDVVLQPAAAITGTVLNADSNRAAANVPVMLQCVHDLDQNMDNDPTEEAEAFTDESGRYRLGALRAGKYNVWATAPGKTVVALDSFEVKTGETREAPVMKLIDGGVLAGRLVDAATGEAVHVDDDEYVSIGVHGPSRPRSGAAIDGDRVNTDGTFRFRLPPGKHYVYLSGIGSFSVAGDERGAREVTIRDGETRETNFTVSRTTAAEPAIDVIVQADPEAASIAASADHEDSQRKAAGQDDSLRNVPMDSLQVRVVNSAGDPIAGATLLPYAFRIGDRGGHFGWSKGNTLETSPQKSTTDETGIAGVRFPRYCGKPESKTNTVSLIVRHPDYVAQASDAPVSKSPTTIRLASGGSVEIVAKSAGQVIQKDLFGLSVSLTSTPWQQTDEGKRRSPRISAGNSVVRAVWLPKDGPALFSRMTDVNVTENGTTSVEVDLQPGVVLAGTLGDDVPRPVKNGIAMVCIEMPGRITWHDWLPINKDGSFEFESLPGGEDAHAQIAVICDGYVSKPLTDSDLANGTGAPQTVPLVGELASHVVDMIPTASAKVLLTEQDGKPIPGVRVSLCPNITWSMGSTIFTRQQFRTSESLRNASEERDGTQQFGGQPIQAISDEDGVALIENVPPFEPPFVFVQHDRFQLPIAMQIVGTTRAALLKLVPGKTNELKLVLEPAAAEIADHQVEPTAKAAVDEEPAKKSEQSDRAPDRSGPVLKGQVIDEYGKPIPDVSVILYGGMATRLRGQETNTDANGEYEVKPLNTGAMMSPDEGGSEWYTGVQFKHPRFVPADGKSWRDISVPIEKDYEEILDLKMTRGGRIRGTIIDPESKKPIPNLDLRIYDGAIDKKDTGNFHVYATTDANGWFTSESLFPGHYIIDINDNDYQGKHRFPRIGEADVKAGETTVLRLTAQELSDLLDPFRITGTAVGEDGKSMVYGGVGVRILGEDVELRTRGGGIDGRNVFGLVFGPIKRGQSTADSPYGVGTLDVDVFGNNKREGYTLIKRTPSEPLRITDDPRKPEVEDGIRYIRPNQPVKFELIFAKDEQGAQQ